MATLSELRNLGSIVSQAYAQSNSTFLVNLGTNILNNTENAAWTDLEALPGANNVQYRDFLVRLVGNTAITAGQVVVEGSQEGTSGSTGTTVLSLPFELINTGALQGNLLTTAIAVATNQIQMVRVHNPGFRFVRIRISTAFTGATTGVRASNISYFPRNIPNDYVRATLLGTPGINLTQLGGATLSSNAGGLSGGTIRTVEAVGGTGTSTSVATSTTAAILVNALSSRVGLIIFNEAAATLRLALGFTASATTYTVIVPANAAYEVPDRFAGLLISGQLTAGTGNARITALT